MSTELLFSADNMIDLTIAKFKINSRSNLYGYHR
jgi:hypothetical protein